MTFPETCVGHKTSRLGWPDLASALNVPVSLHIRLPGTRNGPRVYASRLGQPLKTFFVCHRSQAQFLGSVDDCSSDPSSCVSPVRRWFGKHQIDCQSYRSLIKNEFNCYCGVLCNPYIVELWSRYLVLIRPYLCPYMMTSLVSGLLRHPSYYRVAA